MVKPPTYSIQARFGLAALKSRSNDIDVYVEDNKSWRLVERIVTSNAPRKYKLKSVTPLGGRDTVIRYSKQAPQTPGRTEVYIYDPDIEILAFENLKKSRHSIPLSKYCVENFYLDFYNLRHSIIGEHPELSDREIELQLDISDIKYELKLFDRLYAIYGAARRLGYSKTLTRYPFSSLSLDKGGYRLPDRSRINDRSQTLLIELRNKYGRERVLEAYQFASRRQKHLADPFTYLSGKSVIFPIVYYRLKRELKFKGTRDGMVTRSFQGPVMPRCDLFRRRLSRKLALIG